MPAHTVSSDGGMPGVAVPDVDEHEMAADRRGGDERPGTRRARPGLRSRRVLVIAPDARLRVCVAGELVDYAVELVADVRAGVHAVAREHPATVVLSLPLSDLAGRGIVTRIRVLAPLTRVVVCVTPARRASAGGARGARPVAGGDGTELLAGAIGRSIRSADPSMEAHDPTASMSVAARRGGPAIARRFARAHLQRWQLAELADDAALIVSELVTNAVFHTDGRASVRLVRGAHVVRLEVWDAGAGVPELLAPDEYQPGGRGLTIVSALADVWGISTLPGGKVVWAELAESGP